MLDRKNLLSGTRPEVGHRILTTSGHNFDGYQIMDYKGMVWGISIRAKDAGTDFFMGIKQFFGGELTSFTELADEGRQRAVDKMLDMARRLGANAIVNFNFHNENVMGLTEVTAFGTAVIIKPIQDYVPAGAVGNILAELVDNSVNTANTENKNINKKYEYETIEFDDSIKTDYPLASLKISYGKLVALCPTCNMIYATSMSQDNKIQVKAYTDYDKDVEGQQIECENCRTVFTLPSVNNEKL
jgi:uncharacterized protein YbjQ (UPF0145 family)